MEDSGTSTTPTTGDRPSFADVFASDTVAASPAADPSTETTTTAPASVDATAPPVDAAGDVTPTAGPIPLERHKAVLDAAYKERDSYKTQFDALQQQVAQSTQANAEFAKVSELYQTNRPEFVRTIFAEAMQDPTLAPMMRSEAARALGTRTQAQPSTGDLEPDIPVMDVNGQVVSQAYSAERVKQLIASTIKDALAKEVGPIRQDFQTRQAREQAAAAEKQLNAQIDDLHAELLELPGFKEHEQAITEAMRAIPGDAAKAARKAWLQVVGSKLSNADETRAKQLDDLKNKAHASTVNPAGAAIASTHRPKDFNDPSLTW